MATRLKVVRATSSDDHRQDRGKRGRVLEARPGDKRVVVENLNMVKRHQERGR